MKYPTTGGARARLLGRLCAALGLLLALAAGAAAQTSTSGGTVINNQITGTFTDAGGGSYTTTSNPVTVTVSNVSGLSITPDGGGLPTVVPGQQNVPESFRLTNTGNFTDRFRFLASGASLRIMGPGVLASAYIDADGSGTVNAGDVDILHNSGVVDTADVLQGGHLDVLVRVNVNSNAPQSDGIIVTLGDAVPDSNGINDSLAADGSAHEVRTVNTSANGAVEASGDQEMLVEPDAQLVLTLTAPAGPVALGGTVTYGLRVENQGARAATGRTLGGASAVYLVLPVPAGTSLKAGQSLPSGTLYTTDALTTPPLLASWSASAPGNLSLVTRVALPAGASVAAGGMSPALSVQVTVKSGVNASVPLKAIADVFAVNGLGADITDQSGDTSANAGDGNANFTEGAAEGASDGDGIVQQTLLQVVGAALLGPAGQPGASATTTDDDFTNLSTRLGVQGIAPGGSTNAADTLYFDNTLQNAGNGDDTFTLTSPTVPSGFTVAVSLDGGGTYTTLSGGGSAGVTLAYGGTRALKVRVGVPSGVTVYTAYPTVIRAASANTPSATNSTVDRAYTGYVRGDVTTQIANATGLGGATDPVPGADIAYTLAFQNLAAAGGTGNATLTAANLQFVGPVPASTDFKLGSAAAAPGTSGLTAAYAYSSDGGASYTYTPVSGGGGAPAGYDRQVTHVRVSFTGTLAAGSPNNAAAFSYAVRIR